ncbi:UDP-glucuronosyl/UDP-glucosyltransferase [Dillenia turbinata]|uniref:UDP-glucuronosyl/UDP-glucosyltransferase n=1 Tax=Dillenia turbinata TaxID=194707 RepID=A0AAN8Z3V0_9MAGN
MKVGIDTFGLQESEALDLQKNANATGLIVRWCDQLGILCHSSVGAYLTNCGRKSTLEGIDDGVPELKTSLGEMKLLALLAYGLEWRGRQRVEDKS